MNLLYVNLLFKERIVQALCWTLVHSLWQGVLLAVLTGLVILLTRRSAPVLRYGLFSTLFILFILVSCLTFLRQWDRAGGSAASGIVIPAEDRVSPGTAVEKGEHGVIVLPVDGNWTDRMANYFNDHAYIIVTIWLIFFSIRLARITAQWGAQQRLRHYRVHPPSAYWTDRLGELARRLKIKVQVKLLESEIVKVPMMAGFIKPVILLPFSILSQLSPAQVEAVLLHELAHIRRKDYIVNLLFSLGEMFFFFNPGVLWICSLIREERENCCDDIAVRQSGSKKEFISALVSFQDHDRKAGLCTLAFPGSGDHLLQRVRRIVYRDNKTLDGGEKFFLICCFLLSGALMLAFTHAAPVNGHSLPQRHDKTAYALPLRTASAGSPFQHALKDSLPPENEPAALDADGDKAAGDTAAPVQPIHKKIAKKVKVKVKDDDELGQADGQRPQTDTMQQKAGMEQRQADIQERQNQITQRHAEMEQRRDTARKRSREGQEARLDSERLDRRREAAERAKSAVIRDQQKQATGEQKKMVKKEEQKIKMQQKEPSEQQRKIEELERRIAEQQSQLREEERRLVERDQRIGEEQQRLQEEKQRQAQTRVKEQTDMAAAGDVSDFEAVPSKPAVPAVPGKMTIPPNNLKAQAMRAQTNKKVINPIIDELIAERLIDDKEVLSFSLDNNELIVNGVKQPDELQQRFRQKFLGDPGDHVTYSRTKSSESETISIHPSVKISIHP